jgi:hypothetical protein
VIEIGPNAKDAIEVITVVALFIVLWWRVTR